MILLKNVYLNGQTQDVLINGNRFEKIGSDIKADGAEVLNCKDKAILPTFCNMHTHAPMMFLRGVGEDLELFDWLQKEIWPREAKLDAESVYHLSKFAILEMIKTGTTAFLDMYFYAESVIKPVDEMGVRAVLTYFGMDMFDDKETTKHIQNAENFLSLKMPCERISHGISAHSVYTESERFIKTFKDLAKDAGVIYNIHLSETKKEVQDCLEKYGKRPGVLLDEWGILDDKTVLAHAVHLDDDEINRIGRAKSVIAHNPASNLKLNSGQMPLQKYLDKGLRVTLGTDSVSSNNSLSMLSEMKLAAMSGKNQACDCCAAKVNDIFDMATVNGFQALGIKAGRIEEGYLADFMLVDLHNFALMPCYNLISNMVYAADSSCITDVFCDGKQLMKNGYVDAEDEIIENFQRVCKDLL